MKISLIVAAANNRCIGIHNSLPWHLPEDLKYFKRVTMGKPIIMGRKTFESIGKPLPGRTNIVITRNADYKAEGIKVVTSLENALTVAEAIVLADGKDEAMIIGGAGIFALCLPRAERLYYTQIHAEVAGDTFFPAVNWSEWKLTAREDHKACEKNTYDYSFCVYEKKV